MAFETLNSNYSTVLSITFMRCWHSAADVLICANVKYNKSYVKIITIFIWY